MILKGPQKGNRFAVKMYCGTKEVMVLERINTNNYVQKAITEETYMSNIYITISGNMKLNNETFEIMVLEGEYTAQTAPEYEDYGAMPSLEFPSETQAVGQDVNIFDKNQFIQGSWNSGSNTRIVAFVKNVKKGESYTIKRYNSKYNFSCGISSHNTRNDNATNSDDTGWKTSEKYTITASKDGYLYMQIKNADETSISPDAILDEDFKLVKGTEINGYSPYNNGSASIVVCNKNMLGFHDFEYNGNGITINCKNNKIHISGTSTKGFSYFFTNHCNIKEINKLILNKKIAISSNIPANVELNFAISGNSYYMQLKENIKTTSKFVSKEINSLYLYIPNNTTINQDLEIQLELSSATDYIAHEEQTLAMPIQKEMLEGDYLDLDNEEEVHTWREVVLDGVNNKITNKHSTIFTETNGFYPLVLEGKDNTHENGDSELAHCNYLKVINEEVASLAVKENCLWWEGKYRTIYLSLPFLSITEANNFLKEKYDAGTPLTIYYKLAEPTRLPFTEAQKAVAKQIRETLHSYKDGTHVYCTDEISAKFNVKYTRDLNEVINNLSQQTLEGGN